ncbi:DUF3717 domain-containing protein [uncultured Oxalicibacterium sp.]|uniref:DUF3717 domain-containing protein n=1 Tax=uncultured Oxalicibacterium sp. TaxID=1168540 RepID=UPI0025FF2A11|nr:DUF3717 domain-containing protein [uncultured Oxalicibacterium sp.]
MELTLTELEQAINHWRQQRPSTGEEHALSAEVNTLAKIYALMIFHHRSSLPLNELKEETRHLIEDWRNGVSR